MSILDEYNTSIPAGFHLQPKVLAYFHVAFANRMFKAIYVQPYRFTKLLSFIDIFPLPRRKGRESIISRPTT